MKRAINLQVFSAVCLKEKIITFLTYENISYSSS